MTDTVKVVYEGDAAGAVKAGNEAAASVQKAGKAAADAGAQATAGAAGMQNLGAGMKEATAKAGLFGSTVNESMKQTQGQVVKVAGSFNMLAGVMGGGGTLGKAAMGLSATMGAFAVGGPIAVGIAGLGLVVGEITKRWEEAHVAAVEAAKGIRKATDESLGKMREKVTGLREDIADLQMQGFLAGLDKETQAAVKGITDVASAMKALRDFEERHGVAASNQSGLLAGDQSMFPALGRTRRDTRTGSVAEALAGTQQGQTRALTAGFGEQFDKEADALQATYKALQEIVRLQEQRAAAAKAAAAADKAVVDAAAAGKAGDKEAALIKAASGRPAEPAAFAAERERHEQALEWVKQNERIVAGMREEEEARSRHRQALMDAAQVEDDLRNARLAAEQRGREAFADMVSQVQAARQAMQDFAGQQMAAAGMAALNGNLGANFGGMALGAAGSLVGGALIPGGGAALGGMAGGALGELVGPLFDDLMASLEIVTPYLDLLGEGVRALTPILEPLGLGIELSADMLREWFLPIIESSADALGGFLMIGARLLQIVAPFGNAMGAIFSRINTVSLSLEVVAFLANAFADVLLVAASFVARLYNAFADLVNGLTQWMRTFTGNDSFGTMMEHINTTTVAEEEERARQRAKQDAIEQARAEARERVRGKVDEATKGNTDVINENTDAFDRAADNLPAGYKGLANAEFAAADATLGPAAAARVADSGLMTQEVRVTIENFFSSGDATRDAAHLREMMKRGSVSSAVPRRGIPDLKG